CYLSTYLSAHPVGALHRHLDARLVGELVERIPPPRRVDEVGGDHRVVVQLRGTDGELGRTRIVQQGRRSPAGLLPVVGDQRPIPPRRQQRRQSLCPSYKNVVSGIGRP